MTSELPLDPPATEERVEQEQEQHTEETPANGDVDAPEEPARQPSPLPLLPEIPGADFDLDLSSILNVASPDPESDKVQKRASNVLKLSQENEKLKAELKAMTDRLEAAEKRREQLARKQQPVMEAPSS
ncbi:hypothetical protein B0H15DRAFT_823669 [Mycena belliarum]|uniref:Uncharacterized protein n=1 Tax=Mycena belliarum TaxID=1033014 RepID=A0AAD6XWJ8_9AGAR|nr:hypothetical protein B0H15DRAFT_823669 [Mycena belliae]